MKRKIIALFFITGIMFFACSTTEVVAQGLSPERTKELEKEFPTKKLYIQGLIDAEDWLFHLDAATGGLGLGESTRIKGEHIGHISELLLFGRHKGYITDEQYRRFRNSDLLKYTLFREREAVVWNEFRGNR